MANFNPDLEAAAPNNPSTSYLGLAKSISPFELKSEVDQSKGSLYKGIGDILETTTKGVDNTLKTIIDSALHAGVDREREGFTGAIEQVAGIPEANRVADYQPDGADSNPNYGSGSLTSQQNVPSAVQSGLGSAANLVSAAGNGKLSPSYYEGRLDLVAKDLRSRFPGHRDYIDEKISSMTGGNPANKYITEILQQINQRAQNNLTARQKLQSDIMSDADKGFSGAREMYQMVSTNPDLLDAGMKVAEWRSRYNALDWQTKQAKNSLELAQTDVAGKKLIATQNNNELFNGILNNAMFTTENTSIPFSQLPDMIQKLSGKEHDPVRDNELATRLTASIASLKQQMYTSANQSGSANVLGADLSPQIENHPGLKVLEAARDAVKKGDYDMASSAANYLKSVTAKNGERIFGDPNSALAKYALIEGTINQIAGPNGSRNLQGAITGVVAPNINDSLKAFVTANAKSLATGGSTLKDIMQDYQSKNIGNPPVDSQGKPLPGADSTKRDRGVYNSTIQSVGAIINSATVPDELKRNVFAGAYSEKNYGLTDMFSDDRVINGQLYKGKHSIFVDMTAPATTDQAWKFGQQNPQIWQNYKQFAENEFRHLFGSDVKFLDSAANGGYKIAFDSDKTEFKAIPTGGSTPTTNFIAGMSSPAVNVRLAGLNSALQTMRRINDKGGTDSNAYLLNILRENSTEDSQTLRSVQTALSGGKKAEGPNPELTDFKPESSGASIEDVSKGRAAGLNPEFRSGLESAISDYQGATGKNVKIDDLVRTRDEQAQAYSRFLSGKTSLAAPPGHSRHEVGEAADINSDPQFLGWLKSQDVSKYGLEFLPGRAGAVDPGHIQLRRKVASK